MSTQEEQKQQQEARLQEQLEQIKHTLVVMSGKGGVGKSTVTTNVAVALAQRNYKVGLIDADIHGPNIPKMFGIERSQLMSTGNKFKPVMYYPNLKLVSVALLLQSTDEAVIWRGPLKHSLIRQFLSDIQWGQLDYLVVDLPPGTGDEPLSVAQTIKRVSGAIIVTTPQDVAVLDAKKTATFAVKLNMPIIGIVENMSGFICPHCGKLTDIFKSGGGEKAAEELGVPFLGKIPFDPQMVDLCDAGKPYIEKLPNSEIAQVFAQIADQCEQG
ncbi:ATP-binding protein, CobQ/CobB/MinD/ParA family [Candidatus Vecturithrix granuli]|uniref:Iron-sulfur cluster carrier protein n=1 Tax=Vecturithrix granuli TaxID=1499967 RepID=A0A081BWY5_VECG1|nr:ATP-binding protein, CobQ/CobB/MinD/ParA family [Candidatus Vecturithrix granuli]